CPIHKKPVETIKEEVYFFKLSQYQSKIIQLIESDQVKIRPFERKNEVLGFLQHKLEDTAITRSKVEWGIPVPWDEKQTIYVWVDALLNYLSVVENPKFETQKPKLKEFWSPDLQLIGKDILRFHAVIWLGLLLSAKLKLPKQLYVHGFFTINKQKMSKSLGNVITIQELITKYGLDATRYLLISSFPFGKDGNFSFEELDRRYESELANELGNLVQRTVVLAKKLEVKFNPKNPDYCKKIQIKLKNIDFSGALQIIRNRIIKANQFVNKTKPWEFQDKISKSRDKKQKEIYQKELNSILNTLLQKVEKIAIDLASFMPDTSKIILAQLTTQNPIPLFPKK
ncbi:methionine--tRNA ligase, partial [Candidatus Berkelbacteria bacterium CG_4_9_14_3_um_filter_33_5]